MNTETLIGQLFIISLETSDYRPGQPQVLASITDFKPAGAILVPPPCRSRSALRKCLDEIQELNSTLGLPSPFIVCADHRGGEGSLTSSIPGGLEFPAPMAQCALGTEGRRAGEEIGRVLAEDALCLGLNLNLAPYADFVERDDIEGCQFGQAFMGSDPAMNAELSGGLVRGFHEAGLGATYCVFPGGYGSLPRDPHFFTGTIDAPLKEIEQRYLGALKASMAEGVDAVMLSHWAFPALDCQSRPVTYSEPAIRYLRQTLGFEGLIMTDAIQMRSAADLAGPGGGADAAVLALEAGVDIILMGTWAERQAVAEAHRTGRLTRQRLEEAFERVLALKRRLTIAQGEGGATPRADHVAAMNRWIEKSLTWFKKPQRPLDPQSAVTCLSAWDSFAVSVRSVCPSASLRYLQSYQYFYGRDGAEAGMQAQIRALLSWTKTGETVLMSTYTREELRTAAALQAAGRKVHVIHAGPPFHAKEAANVESLLLCYAKLPVTLDLAVRAIFGRAQPGGVFPIAIQPTAVTEPMQRSDALTANQ